VVQNLSKLGIGSAKLTAVGYGSSKPADSNDTPEGRANNRRIEFVVK
jgi:outer membrane protein OmpA-like peptidoglycan-associated protein